MSRYQFGRPPSLLESEFTRRDAAKAAAERRKTRYIRPLDNSSGGQSAASSSSAASSGSRSSSASGTAAARSRGTGHARGATSRGLTRASARPQHKTTTGLKVPSFLRPLMLATRKQLPSGLVNAPRTVKRLPLNAAAARAAEAAAHEQRVRELELWMIEIGALPSARQRAVARRTMRPLERWAARTGMVPTRRERARRLATMEPLERLVTKYDLPDPSGPGVTDLRFGPGLPVPRKPLFATYGIDRPAPSSLRAPTRSVPFGNHTRWPLIEARERQDPGWLLPVWNGFAAGVGGVADATDFTFRALVTPTPTIRSTQVRDFRPELYRARDSVRRRVADWQRKRDAASRDRNGYVHGGGGSFFQGPMGRLGRGLKQFGGDALTLLLSGPPPEYSSYPSDHLLHYHRTFNPGAMEKVDKAAAWLSAGGATLSVLQAMGVHLGEDGKALVRILDPIAKVAAVYEAHAARHAYHDRQISLGQKLEKDFSALLAIGPSTVGLEGLKEIKRLTTAKDAADLARQAESEREKLREHYEERARRRKERARGGRVGHGETTLVGERGPEIVRFPGGADGTAAGRARGLLSRPAVAGSATQRRREMHLHQNLDGREVARSTVRHVDDEQQWGWA